MKAKTLPILAFLAALAASLLPISAGLAGLLVFVTGLATILVADYAAPSRAARAYLAATAPAKSTLRLAA